MIYRVNDSEHFNLVLRITPIENHRQFDAHIEIDVALWNKKNGRTMRKKFDAANFYQALRLYDEYEDMFFGKREEVE